MSSTTIFLIIGCAIGLYIGWYSYRYGGDTDVRKPKRPFPKQWREILIERIEFYNRLNREKKTEFERRVHIFLLNVQVVGIDTEATHLDRVLVASGAVIPIFRFANWHYINLEEVHIYPDKFQIPTTDKMASGLVGWGAMEGKMMLSRKALHHGFYDQTDQKNIAIHEFIHILDKQDGKMDGVLDQVMNEVDIMPWLHIINQKMKEIDSGHSTIRDYGAANKPEFLAVVSEFFFESPERMRLEHPALYNALDSFFNQKGAKRKGRGRGRNRNESRGRYNKGR